MPPEGPNPGPARRGRRNPQIAQAMEAEGDPVIELQDEDLLADAGEATVEDGFLLLPGDVVMAKVSLAVDIFGKEAWFSYGLQTRVLEGESEPDVFDRAASVVNSRVLDMAENAYERIAAAQEEHDRELAEQRAEQGNTPTQSARLQPRRTR